MRYLKLFESFEDIDKICRKYNISNYVVNPDRSIDVDEDVNLHNLGLEKLPLKFNKVNGWFDCGNNKLTSLEGSPVEVNGSFFCGYNNNLTSFKFSPKIIRDILIVEILILNHLNIFQVMLKNILIVMIIQYMKYGNYLKIGLKLNY